MDPLSITVGVASLITSVGKASIAVNDFVREVRGARRDLDRVARELSSLQMSLEALAEDCKDENVHIPSSLEENLKEVLQNCLGVVMEIETMLVKMLDGGMKLRRKIEWSISAKGDMERLRVNLEAHKSSLNIALDAIQLSLLKNIKNDTAKLNDKSDAIQDNTKTLIAGIAKIDQGIEALHVQMTSMPIKDERRIPLDNLVEASQNVKREAHAANSEGPSDARDTTSRSPLHEFDQRNLKHQSQNSTVANEFPRDSKFSCTQDERQLFSRVFREYDPEELGVVTGDEAVRLFERTKLPKTVLGRIWHVVDTQNRGFLIKSDFVKALRLIGYGQEHPSIKLSLDRALSPGPLPRFIGINMSWPESGTKGSDAIPPLFPQRLEFYRREWTNIHAENAENGLLSGSYLQSEFERYGLSNDTLGDIWELVDTENRGALNQTEFILAIHLIDSLYFAELTVLPSTIPQAFYEAAS